MNGNKKNNTEIAELILALVNHSISDEQFTRLKEMLTHDLAARRYYVEFLLVNIGLCKHSETRTSVLPPRSAFDSDDEFLLLEELTEYEKNGTPVEVERKKEPGERILTEKEREAKIQAFLREEKVMEEQERRLEQEARRKIRERELRRRRRIETAHNIADKVRRYI
ncbi:MAG TPA: hypothetical protein HPP87_02655, partial [Planctomycetes bacterium]|nr:hypothetical protein [Planctomycetota bacterium]